MGESEQLGCEDFEQVASQEANVWKVNHDR